MSAPGLADSLRRRLAADLFDLRQLRDFDPVAAEQLRAALVGELAALHMPQSLTERALEDES